MIGDRSVIKCEKGSQYLKVTTKEQSHFKVFYNVFIEKTVKWLTPERIKLYSATICILTFVAWGISQYIGPGLIDASGTIIGSDFLAFYTAGKFYLNNRVDQLYDFEAIHSFETTITNTPIGNRNIYFFLNPPFTAPFFSLFSHSNYLTGLIIWWSLGLFLIFFSISLLRTELKELASYSISRLFLTCFLFFPTMFWFINGQNTSISLFLYTVIYIMLRRNKDFLAGLALGLLLYKPQLGIAIAFVLLIKRRWQALIGGFVTACTLIVISFVTMNELAVKSYLKVTSLLPEVFRLNSSVKILQPPTWGQDSFFGFSSLLLDNISKVGADCLYIFLCLLSFAVIVILWENTPWEPKTRTWDMAISSTLAQGLLIAPHLFQHDLMLLLLPFAVVWSHYAGGTNGRALDGGPLLFWSALVYLICFIGNIISYAQLRLCNSIGLPQFAVQFTTLIILGWAYAVVYHGRDKEPQVS